MRPESKQQFYRAADVLALNPATRDLAWRRIADLGLSPDDPTVIYLAVAGLLEAAATTIPGAIDALPARMEEAAKRAVGPVAKAAKARVEAAHADLAEQTGAAVATAAVAHFERADRAHSIRLGFHLVTTLTVIALICGITGWIIGRTNVSGVATEWAALAARADSTDWFALTRANTDLSQTLRQYCVPGAPGVLTVNGRRACSIPLWLEGSVAPRPGAAQGIYNSAADALSHWGPFWLLGLGLFTGLFGRKVLLTIASTGPVAWLLK